MVLQRDQPIRVWGWADKNEPVIVTFDGKTYWLLLSKGYKTYKFLHTFFNAFYPCVDVETPAEYTVGGVTLPCYGMERALQQEMLRADAGLVEMRDGVVTGKRNCRDL